MELIKRINTTDLVQVHNAVSASASKVEASFERAKESIEKIGPKLPSDIDDKLIVLEDYANKELKKHREQRMESTRIFDSIKKAFTEEEARFSVVIKGVQSIRNESARIYQKEIDEKNRIAQEKAIEVAYVENRCRSHYAEMLNNYKANLLKLFNNVDLDNADEISEMLQNVADAGGEFNYEVWDSLSFKKLNYVNADEFKTIDLRDKCIAHFEAETKNYASYLLSLKDDRLEQIKEGIIAEQLELEAKEVKETATENVAITEKVEVQNLKEEAPKVLSNVKVSVTGVDGWRKVIDYYLENSGIEFEKLETTRLSSMRIFAERNAKKTGEFIEHNEIKYETEYKAGRSKAR